MYNQKTNDSLLRDDSGAGTAWWVLWMIIFMVFGGVSIDSANAWRMRAELQATADAAAHAGAVALPDRPAARAAAQAMATANMNETDHGDVLSTADADVGMWNDATGKFVAFPDSPPIIDAIRVVTRRDATNANRLKTSFLRLIGLDSWNVSAQAVAQRYFPDCNNRDGIFAVEIVDLQSNNDFKNGICIHGNDHVELNNNNTWESGVTVTMPNLEDLVTPSSDIDVQNPGLSGALGEEWFIPKIVYQIPDIIEGLKDPTSAYIPSYIGKYETGGNIPAGEILVNVDKSAFNPASLVAGHIYNVSCATGGNLLNLGSASEIAKVVIVTDCRVNTGQGTYFHDAILASSALDKTSGTDPKSINIGQSNKFGADDGCSPGGNFQMFAKHSIHGAAALEAYGAQFVAGANIQIAAQAEGLEGILLQAGKDVSITSNNSFGSTCAAIGALQSPYFRLVL